MTFADLKNDFVFRRIFATHPDILRGLLNDLLDRTGDQAIASIEYLPSEQLPLVAGAKLSILDVRCTDERGAIFIVEMQLIHVAGFVNRVVYNGCKAYVNQLKAGEPYTNLADVVAISICDFELWPDAQQRERGEPPMPMLSRFAMTENSTGNRALLQVQYAFLELPKVPKQQPAGGAPLWAWLFVHAPELAEMPADLPPGPFRQAMELAKEASFTDLELEAYRKVMDEIQQAREYGAAKWDEGHQSGLAEGKRAALLRLLARRGVALTEEDQRKISLCGDQARLDQWLDNALTASTAGELFA
jgi:predicted transposase/invertase (TIGR01784 family)